jgi:PTH1 family peptidyl-tRNA hydrolase
MLIDKLAAEAGATVKRKECRSLVGSATIENERVRLVKPQTFMNLSGEAVACLLAKEAIENVSKSLIVISDDLALPFGTIRLRERGSAGGHNGLKSIIASIGTNEFMRLRIGIRPEHQVSNAKAFVLDDFSKAHREEVEMILGKTAEAVHSVLRDGIKKAMSEYN